MPLSAGDRLGPYEVLAPIGAGGMGEVWRARDTRLDRTVAIKTCKVEFNERFEREARAVSALNHPHICQKPVDRRDVPHHLVLGMLPVSHVLHGSWFLGFREIRGREIRGRTANTRPANTSSRKYLNPVTAKRAKERV